MSALAATPSVPGDLVTVFLSSSPRPQDSENDAGAIMLHQALLSVRRTLGLERAPAVCIFDGRHPALPEEQWAAYQRKISLIKADPLFAGGVTIVEHEEWLHQAHGLQRAMTAHLDPLRPIVFSIQDDTVVFGAVDVPHICRALLEDPGVEYVKLFWRRDIFDHDDETPNYEVQPGTPHPSSDLIHRTHFWSDRPHFALVSHYNERVWPRIGDADRVTMEQACEAASSEDGDTLPGAARPCA